MNKIALTLSLIAATMTSAAVAQAETAKKSQIAPVTTSKKIAEQRQVRVPVKATKKTIVSSKSNDGVCRNDRKRCAANLFGLSGVELATPPGKQAGFGNGRGSNVEKFGNAKGSNGPEAFGNGQGSNAPAFGNAKGSNPAQGYATGHVNPPAPPQGYKVGSPPPPHGYSTGAAPVQSPAGYNGGGIANQKESTPSGGNNYGGNNQGGYNNGSVNPADSVKETIEQNKNNKG